MSGRRVNTHHRLLAAIAGVAAANHVAAAGPAPGTLAPGTGSVTLTTEVNASRNASGEPVSIAPDLAVGVTPRLTLAIIHSTFGITGFRGSAGRGLCVTGADAGCPRVYPGGGLEATFGLVHGALGASALLGAYALDLDAGHHGAKLGFKLKYTHGRAALTSMPSVFVAATAREGMPPNRDLLWFPVIASYALGGGVSASVAAGVKGPLASLGERYELALAGGFTYAITPSWTLGGTWAHGKLVAGDAVLPEGTRGRDLRAIHLWVTTML